MSIFKGYSYIRAVGSRGEKEEGDGMENGIRAVDRSSRSRAETQCQQ